MSQLKSEQEWLRTVGTLLVAFFCLSIGLNLAQTAVVPFVLAALITITAAPLIDWQTRHGGIPHPLAVLSTLTLVLSIVAVVTALVVYAAREATKTARDQWDPTVEVISELAIEWGLIDQEEGGDALAEPPAPSGETDDAAAAEPPSVAATPAEMVNDYLERARNQFIVDNTDLWIKIVSQAVLTAIFVGFLLAGYRPAAAAAGGLGNEIVRRVRRYVSTKFFISATTGVLVWLVMVGVNFQYAPLFGVLAFVLNFIPSIGSIVCTLLPLPLALAEYDSWGPVVAVIALPGAVQLIIGNIIEPKIMGDGLDLHPATILLSLAFWGIVWGPVGMLLAAPLAASARIILGRIGTTRPIAELMAGRLSDLAVYRT